MYDKNHYNTVISLQLIKINEKNKQKTQNEWILKKTVYHANTYIPQID